MTKIWYCPNCGYEVDRGGRCHSCREALVASPLPELAPGDPEDEVGYRLDDWEDDVRGELIDALIDNSILHRFEEDELVIAAHDEEAVDALVAEVSGRSPDEEGGDEEQVRAFDEEQFAPVLQLVDAARRLRADPTDMIADADLGEASAMVFLIDELPGIDEETWAAVGRVTRRLLGALSAEEALEEEIATQASILVRLLEPVLTDLGLAQPGAGQEPPPAGIGPGGESPAAGETGAGAGPSGDEGAGRAPVGPGGDGGPGGVDAATAGEREAGEDADAVFPAAGDVTPAGEVTGGGRGDELVYEMTGWFPEQRAELAVHLEQAGITYQWEGDDLVVPASREEEVDALFERIEGVPDEEIDDEERYHALEELFGAADRLTNDPDDDDRRREALDAVEDVTEGPPLFALDDAQWWQIKTMARTMADAISDDAPSDQVRRRAVALRDVLRELV